jgi:hypothetical protein
MNERARPRRAGAAHILGAVSEFEREIIRERTKLGLAKAKRTGVRLDRPPVRRPRCRGGPAQGSGEVLPRGVRRAPVRNVGARRVAK